MHLTYADIADIIREVDQGNLDQLTFEVGELHVEIRRRGAVPPPPQPGPSDLSPPPGPTAIADDAGSPGMPREGVDALAPAEVAVRSPMVGTFYGRSSPDAPPFVEEGAVVAEGDPLCLVEVMKLFTTVHASHAGRIVRVAVDDGDMVEYDQLLFVIDTDSPVPDPVTP